MTTPIKHTQKQRRKRSKSKGKNSTNVRRGSVVLPLPIHHFIGLSRLFRRVSQRIGKVMGSPICFVAAVLFVLLWLFSGPYFAFSDTWQLVINTSTTIMTFLMVFLLQNTQNRDTKALHLKLDELIDVNEKARNLFLDAEDEMDDAELEEINRQFREKRND